MIDDGQAESQDIGPVNHSPCFLSLPLSLTERTGKVKPQPNLWDSSSQQRCPFFPSSLFPLRTHTERSGRLVAGFWRAGGVQGRKPNLSLQLMVFRVVSQVRRW